MYYVYSQLIIVLSCFVLHVFLSFQLFTFFLVFLLCESSNYPLFCGSTKQYLNGVSTNKGYIFRAASGNTHVK